LFAFGGLQSDRITPVIRTGRDRNPMATIRGGIIGLAQKPHPDQTPSAETGALLCRCMRTPPGHDMNI